MLMSETTDAFNETTSMINLGIYTSGDNVSSESAYYSGAVFNIRPTNEPDNRTFYILAGSTITIRDLFDPSGVLPEGFVDVGGYNSNDLSWEEITRTLQNGDGSIKFRWNTAMGTGSPITIVVIDNPDLVQELEFLSNPSEGQIIFAGAS